MKNEEKTPSGSLNLEAADEKLCHPVTDGTWADSNCGAEERFACRKKSDSTSPIVKPTPPPKFGNCPDGWIKIETGCYQIKGSGTDSKTFDDARADCQSVANGDLPSVHDQGVQCKPSKCPL